MIIMGPIDRCDMVGTFLAIGTYYNPNGWSRKLSLVMHFLAYGGKELFERLILETSPCPQSPTAVAMEKSPCLGPWRYGWLSAFGVGFRRSRVGFDGGRSKIGERRRNRLGTKLIDISTVAQSCLRHLVESVMRVVPFRAIGFMQICRDRLRMRDLVMVLVKVPTLQRF